MKKLNSILLIGGIMVVIGFVVPLLMVMEIVPKLLWLEMVIAVMQTVGLGMGIIGGVLMVKSSRGQD